LAKVTSDGVGPSEYRQSQENRVDFCQQLDQLDEVDQNRADHRQGGNRDEEGVDGEDLDVVRLLFTSYTVDSVCK
jgi:hypothetical protein